MGIKEDLARAEQLVKQRAGLAPAPSPGIQVGLTPTPSPGIQVGLTPTPGPGKPPSVTGEDAERLRRSEQLRREREKDIQRGVQRGQELFAPGALGRVREERSADVTDILARRREQLAGLQAPEFQALRETRLRGLQRQEQQQARSLRGFQGAAGIRGGLAGQQAVQLAGQQQQQRQAAEQQLLLQNVTQRQQALGSFQQAVGGAEASELQRQQANIEARRRELLGVQTFALGEAGLGVAERSAAIQEALGRAQAEAALAAGDGGGKK